MNEVLDRTQNLTASTQAASSLTSDELKRLFVLFRTHYDNVSYDRFLDDFAQKSHVILLRDENRRLQGFSTLIVWPLIAGGRQVRIAFSGDTVIDRAYWGSSALAFEWLRLTSEIYADDPHTPLYWLLCCKSPRTYRYLSLFYRRFFPADMSDGTAAEARIADEVCRMRFDGRYDAKAGIVRAEPGSAFLRPEFAETRGSILGRADLDRYTQLNPGYACGDELACLAHIVPENHQAAARRRFERAREAAHR